MKKFVYKNDGLDILIMGIIFFTIGISAFFILFDRENTERNSNNSSAAGGENVNVRDVLESERILEQTLQEYQQENSL